MLNHQQKKFIFWSEQVLIFLAHLFLLAWIIFVLYQSGKMTTNKIIIHFTGLSLYGASLIRICAYLAHRRYIKEIQNKKI